MLVATAAILANVYEGVALVVLVTGALIGIGRYHERRIRAIVKEVVADSAQTERTKTKDDIKDALVPVVHELTTNSGGSLKDAVIRLDEWRKVWSKTVEYRLDRQDRALGIGKEAGR